MWEQYMCMKYKYKRPPNWERNAVDSYNEIVTEYNGDTAALMVIWTERDQEGVVTYH